MQSIGAAQYLIVSATLLMCNLFEWCIYRFVIHRPSEVPLFRAVYSRHTLIHHQFFTEREIHFADHHSWHVTFFPPYSLVVFMLMSIPGAFVLGWLFSPNVGWLFILTKGLLAASIELSDWIEARSCWKSFGRRYG